MVEENHLEIKNFIYPLFVVEGKEIKKEIPSMPGQHQFSLDKLSYEIQEISKLQIPAVLLFGIPSYKDETGSEAWNPDGIIQKAIKIIKKENPELLVITDVCLCEYTSHGHCGVIEKNGMVNNDKTLDLLAREAVSHADAGADMIAPSDMMDGRVGRIRTELDSRGFQNIPILAYSVKYASAFYGPFREAAESTPQFGDRKGYQMNPANSREAVLESDLDIEEGADILMVKPALAYMDVIQKIKEKFNLPLACYNVSGEYAMVKAAAQKGWIDEKRVVLEILTGLKRAGADLIISYHAKEAAVWLKEGTANLKFEQKPDRSELKPVKIKV
jgi:porphobilinogen synthase